MEKYIRGVLPGSEPVLLAQLVKTANVALNGGGDVGKEVDSFLTLAKRIFDETVTLPTDALYKMSSRSFVLKVKSVYLDGALDESDADYLMLWNAALWGQNAKTLDVKTLISVFVAIDTKSVAKQASIFLEKSPGDLEATRNQIVATLETGGGAQMIRDAVDIISPKITVIAAKDESLMETPTLSFLFESAVHFASKYTPWIPGSVDDKTGRVNMFVVSDSMDWSENDREQLGLSVVSWEMLKSYPEQFIVDVDTVGDKFESYVDNFTNAVRYDKLSENQLKKVRDYLSKKLATALMSVEKIAAKNYNSLTDALEFPLSEDKVEEALKNEAVSHGLPLESVQTSTQLSLLGGSEETPIPSGFRSAVGGTSEIMPLVLVLVAGLISIYLFILRKKRATKPIKERGFNMTLLRQLAILMIESRSKDPPEEEPRPTFEIRAGEHIRPSLVRVESLDKDSLLKSIMDDEDYAAFTILQEKKFDAKAFSEKFKKQLQHYTTYTEFRGGYLDLKKHRNSKRFDIVTILDRSVFWISENAQSKTLYSVFRASLMNAIRLAKEIIASGDDKVVRISEITVDHEGLAKKQKNEDTPDVIVPLLCVLFLGKQAVDGL